MFKKLWLQFRPSDSSSKHGHDILAASSKVKPRSVQKDSSSTESSPGHIGIPNQRRDPNTLPHCWTVASHGTMENIYDMMELADLDQIGMRRKSIITNSGHHFILIDFETPTACDCCQELVLGSAHRCNLCYTTCHTECSQKLKVICNRQPKQLQSANGEDLSPDMFETARDLGEEFIAYTPRLRDSTGDSAASSTFPRRSQRNSSTIAQAAAAASQAAGIGSSDSLLSGQNSLLHPSDTAVDDFDDDDDDDSRFSTAPQELLTASTRFSLLSSEYAYSVSSLDSGLNAAAGIRIIETESDLHSPTEVKQVQHQQLTANQQSEKSSEAEFYSSWTMEQLSEHLLLLNENLPGQEFRLCQQKHKLQTKQRKFKGSLRVHVNLLRPIRMEQANSSFFLPRGNACLLHDITSEHSADDVIGLLLTKHRIRDPVHKFALFEHEIQGDKTVQVRKLQRHERPLSLLLLWTQLPRDEMREAFQRRKLILQENESSIVDWNAFTIPELNNFLLILKMEEEQHKKEIRLRFDLVRQQLKQRLLAINNESEA